MDLHAATATDPLPLGWLVLVALVAITGYVIACALFPFAACLRCRGDGKRRSPSGRAWRRCRRCKGTGERIRTGRRAWTYLRRTHERGSR